MSRENQSTKICLSSKRDHLDLKENVSGREELIQQTSLTDTKTRYWTHKKTEQAHLTNEYNCKSLE